MVETQGAFVLVLIAVATHLYSRTFEPTNLRLYLAVLLSEPALYLVLYRCSGWSDVASAYITFFLSLGISIALYRVSPLHPLARYPGPTMNKLTQLWSTWIQSTGHQHIVNKRLHDMYGDIVRIGPNELSVIDVDAATSILGPGGLPKGRYYKTRQDPNAPGNLLVLQGQAHSDRRRLWSRAFTSESLAEFQDPLSKRVEALLDGLSNASKSTNLSTWISLFALDFMGDMVFGEGFEMLENGITHHNSVMSMTRKFSVSLSMLCHVPWAASLVKKLPYFTSNIMRLRKFALERGARRVKRGSTTKDLWYYLSDEAGIEDITPSTREVMADSVLAMVAGSDTTSTGLCNLFYLLMSHPKCLARLQNEIDEVYPPGTTPLDASKHSKMTYLTACINETLRLLPPSLTNGPREVPRTGGGRIINGHFFPGGTQIYVPPYSIHRNPKYFSPSPDDFIPERWLPTEHLPGRIHNLSAFIPFSYGPANCVGRSLARQEMMLVACAVLQKFEISFAEGFSPSSYLDMLHDHFVSLGGDLKVDLKPRF